MSLILNHLNHIGFLFLLILQFKFKVIDLLFEPRIRRLALDCFFHNLLSLFGLDFKLERLFFEVFNNLLSHMHHLNVVGNKLQDLSC